MKKCPVVHFEMPAKDKKRVSKFYNEAFGWEMQNMGPKMSNYLMAQTAETDKDGMVKTPGTINGGFYDREDDSENCHLVVSVDDVKKHIEIVKKAGGKISGDIMDIPNVGKFAMVIDIEGNKIGMLEPVEM